MRYYLLGLILFLFLIPNVSAWFDASYPYRYNITTTGNVANMPYSVNDTFGINNIIFWTQNTSEKLMVYCENLNCSGGNLAIANDTHEKFWENESNSRSGNDPSMIWNINSDYILHMDNVSMIDSARTQTILTKAGDPTVINGVFGKGVHFDGDGDYYTMPELVGDNPTAYTIEFWINVTIFGDSTSNMDDIIRILDGTPSYKLSITTDDTDNNRVRFYQDQTTGTDLGYTGDLETNKWYYMVFIWNGSYCNIWVNGTLVNSWVSDDMKGDAPSLTIGTHASGNTDRDLNGELDELKFTPDVAVSNNYIIEQWETGRNLFSSLESGEAVPTTTTTIPKIDKTELKLLYCEMLYYEQNAQVVSNHNWCSDSDTLAYNVTYEITLDDNVSTVISYREIPCVYGCDNQTQSCKQSGYNTYKDYFIGFVLLVVGIIILKRVIE